MREPTGHGAAAPGEAPAGWDVVIVSCFSENIYLRPYMVAQYFRDAGKRPLILTMGFSHAHKQALADPPEGTCYIPVPAYKKNISVKRIFSHLIFSLRAGHWLRRERPPLIYVCAPPNSAAYFAARAAKKTGAKLIVDVLDVWPEAMPLPDKLKRLMRVGFSQIWRAMRNYGIRHADYALTESAKFSEMVGSGVRKCHVVYLSKDMQPIDVRLMRVPNPRELRIVYLGSINNIGEFDALVGILRRIKAYKVHLEIIGGGETKDELIAQLDEHDIAYTFHGFLYDEAAKQHILSACDFGFNGYKQSTVVALSYKSIEYFGNGVPLINSAGPDTWQIIEETGAGLNYDRGDLAATAARIDALSRQELHQMRLRAREVFEDLFAFEKYRQTMDGILRAIDVQ